ncbi:hypothetical protein HYFRA_00013787 [Hymenoscyphus fraxineus]|uniref:F-box domain-containing protein n=1 Tax=Hymenoscyphus fraxineus TaxID=746836 RepID=A0A9N9PVG2_9HELO|nr:hypothetical protein HYFRA_00013787 [Hymenoscyphus fraxineus]
MEKITIFEEVSTPISTQLIQNPDYQSPKNTEEPPLFRLPIEIRNQIYEYLLISENAYITLFNPFQTPLPRPTLCPTMNQTILNPSVVLPVSYHPPPSIIGDLRPTLTLRRIVFDVLYSPIIHTQILHINRQMHEEAAFILYSRNCFAVQGHLENLTNVFHPQIGPHHAGSIRHLSFPFPSCSHDDHGGLDGFHEQFPNLEEVAFGVPMTKSLDAIEKHCGVDAALKATGNVSAEFKKIPSFRRVRIELVAFLDLPTREELRGFMEGLGWEVTLHPLGVSRATYLAYE